jgi:Uma2 family endonuclease
MELPEIILESDNDIPDVSRISHGETISLLATAFNVYLLPRRLPPIMVDVDVILPVSQKKVIPDLFVTNHRFSRIEKSGLFEGVPDLIIEVVSPQSFISDTVTKFDLYASEEVGEYWVIVPETESITVYQLKDGKYEVMANAIRSGTVHSAVLPDFVLDLKTVFLDYT